MSDSDFSSKEPGRGKAPEWASFFSGQQYESFLQAVRGNLDERGIKYELGEGAATLHVPGEQELQCGFANLAQLCYASPQDQWGEIINRHFEDLFRSRRDQQLMESEMPDYAKVFHLIKLRLFAEELPANVLKDSVWKQIVPGIIGVVALDLPSSIVTVSRDYYDMWGVPEDELIESATSNALVEPVTEQEIQLPDGATLRSLHGDSFFVATRLLALHEHLPSESQNGAMVVVPNRHSVLFHAMVDKSALAAIQHLIQLGDLMYREGPGSISNRLFWYTMEEIVPLPYEIEGHTLNFHPPESFVEALNSIL